MSCLKNQLDVSPFAQGTKKSIPPFSVKFMIWGSELHISPHAGLTDGFNMIPQKGGKSNGTVTASFLENISQLFQISFAINTFSQTTPYQFI